MNDLINKDIHQKFNLGELINRETTPLNQEPINFQIRLDYLYPEFSYKSHFTFNENQLNEKRLAQQEDFAEQLIQCIKEQHFEYGITSVADKLVSEQMKINALATKHTINKLFTDNYDKPDILIGLLQIISRMPVEQISSEGHTMATAAIAHQNIEVKETAIRCFENWEDTKSLEILQNISVDVAWLQDYVNSIINDIREELCLI